MKTLTALFILFTAGFYVLANAVTDVPRNADAPIVDGHPLTAVVITQCNSILAVYMTMPDGRLLRFDQSDGLPYAQLMDAAYTAAHSERIEVSCADAGIEGYEKHEAV